MLVLGRGVGLVGWTGRDLRLGAGSEGAGGGVGHDAGGAGDAGHHPEEQDEEGGGGEGGGQEGLRGGLVAEGGNGRGHASSIATGPGRVIRAKRRVCSVLARTRPGLVGDRLLP